MVKLVNCKINPNYPHPMRLNPKADYSDWQVDYEGKMDKQFIITDGYNIVVIKNGVANDNGNWVGSKDFVDEYFIPAVITNWKGEFK